ncbi:MAG: hypothetical protein ABSH08_06605 [Tepidisphaeraceae bacterium]
MAYETNPAPALSPGPGCVSLAMPIQLPMPSGGLATRIGLDHSI